MARVAIIGVGQSKFVRGYPGSIRELAFEAYREAVQDANITSKNVDASIICSAPEYDKQRSPAGVLAEYLGLTPPANLLSRNRLFIQQHRIKGCLLNGEGWSS